VAGDVFEEYPSGFDFADDPGNVGPQVPLVVRPFALSCHAERLAGVSGKDGVDCAPERSPVEGGNIIPDRRGREVSGALCCDDGLPWVFFPFDKAAGVKVWLGKHEAKIKATGACAE